MRLNGILSVKVMKMVKINGYPVLSEANAKKNILVYLKLNKGLKIEFGRFLKEVERNGKDEKFAVAMMHSLIRHGVVVPDREKWWKTPESKFEIKEEIEHLEVSASGYIRKKPEFQKEVSEEKEKRTEKDVMWAFELLVAIHKEDKETVFRFLPALRLLDERGLLSFENGKLIIG